MTRWLSLRSLLRTLALLIAFAGALDPAITSARTSKPEVAVVAADPASPSDSALAVTVARALDKTFTVIPAAFPASAATVIAGDRLPAAVRDLASPLFAVTAERVGPTVTLDTVRAAAQAPFEARVPITAVARVTGARGRTLDVTLRAGETGLVVDRRVRTLVADDERVPVSLVFLPTSAGAAPLRVTAAVTGVRNTATADVLVDVRDTRWPVLFFDPRPSWMSTFVRRAIERDRRFVVTSRVVTSRNVSRDAGAPTRLDDLAGVSRFDAVIVGAPEGLSESDVNGLEAFLRRRGGSVVLLFDRRVGGPYERLTDVSAWLSRSSSQAKTIASLAPITRESPSADSGAAGLRASEIVWPSPLPAGAELIARTIPTANDTQSHRPVVWRSPVGAGRLVVSGALDAWRFRDRSISAFDRFWQTTIAEAANAALPAVALSVSRAMLAPSEKTDVAVTARDAALSTLHPVRTSVTATLESTASGQTRAVVRLWPGEDVGQFRGVVRAPADTGTYRLIVTADGNRAETPIVVARGIARPTPDGLDLLGAWVGARGGRIIPASRLQELPRALRSALRPEPRLETWHPLRSAWWIVPFALLLGGEWWLRRRRGLA